MAEGGVRRILVVDNDRDITEIVEAVLCDAGFSVAVLNEVDSGLLQQLVDDFCPHLVLLDGQGPALWRVVAERGPLSCRTPPVPTIIFTADQLAADEVRHRLSPRSRQARFTGVLGNPFDIDELIGMVSDAIG